MNFRNSGTKGQIIVTGDEIRRINNAIGNSEHDDSAWFEYALGERMEGYVYFIDWGIYCIVEMRGDSLLYYHMEERHHHYHGSQREWKFSDKKPFMDIRDTTPWDKSYTIYPIVRFLVGRIMEHFNISSSDIKRMSHPKKEPTVPKLQQTIDLFNSTLNAICEKKGYEIIDSTTKNYNEFKEMVSITATVGKRDNIWTHTFYSILIGELGGILYLHIKDFAAIGQGQEYKGTDAVSHLQFIRRHGY
jgi:hypothetical protein